jgi:predicted XRE-type DNA-binding protein
LLFFVTSTPPVIEQDTHCLKASSRRREPTPRKKEKRMKNRVLVCLILLPLGAAATGCTSYLVQSKAYMTDLNYAKPKPGKFRYVKRNLHATTFWDSHKSPEERGSPAYMLRLTSLMVQTMKALLRQANLQDNQALYNVRVSAPGVSDTYFAYVLITAFFWIESRYAVTIRADVIEYL